ncbi:uncharacterized protein LOC142973354 [Anticarsia gemmatalis]|uniref:uncharacterized protein LOC142973354 n=1 Tax=Anticarsia gemmatalis TaxID=129554 RepID=UPI003F76C30D
MLIAKCMYIFIIVAIVDCDNTTQTSHTQPTRTDGSIKSNTVNENNNQTKNDSISVRNFLHKQIGISSRNNNALINATSSENVPLKRAVLIINHDMARQYGKRKRSKTKTESLLYEEYNPDGSVFYSYAMSNLDDVVKFFQAYLETEVCHVRCAD